MSEATSNHPGARCPACGRPVAVARASCVYCGEALPEGLLAPSAASAPAGRAAPETPDPARGVLLILDLSDAEPARLATALGLAAYEAAQRVRRGGCQIHRICSPAEAETEERRLAAAGLRVHSLPEAEVRPAAEPLVALGGRVQPGAALLVRTSEGEQRLEPGQIALLVRGPIRREYSGERPQLRWGLFQMGGAVGLPGVELGVATLEPGYRYHLHRRHEPRPVELDPAGFRFLDDPGPDATLQRRLRQAIDRVGAGAAVDDAFRHLDPALAPAATESDGAQLSLGRLAGQPRRRKPGDLVVLDNLAQFRFYSAWRGVVERRRSAR